MKVNEQFSCYLPRSSQNRKTPAIQFNQLCREFRQ
jgi:hypothetical protein